ncbi:MAG: UDP-N-acetylmuramoyl-tripeptide--D-alanyl-D-alanine ligase [Rickettsiales bacterium]|nr:UDP-N-acetylmuramoyl-tripeptide--D-alanyl-D-alanine ligase [Rickettsiales bacterium]
MLFNSQDLRAVLRDDLVGDSAGDGNFPIDSVVFDSREVRDRTLFVAKRGEKNDGHDFLRSVLETHSTALALAERIAPDLGSDLEKRVILVRDSLGAFENLALFSRNRVRGVVLGITGSIGKTTAKDLLAAMVSRYGRTHWSQMSFNNHIGTLTTLANTPPEVEYLVCEVGVGAIGEMARLVGLVRPAVAVVTNIRPSHISYFSSEENVALEKSQLMTQDTKLAILNGDDRWYEFMRAAASARGARIMTFGTGQGADVRLGEHRVTASGAAVVYEIGGRKYSCDLRSPDRNLAYSAMAGLAFLEYLGFPMEKALETLSTQEMPRGRNNIEYASYLAGGKTVNLTIVNGSYNAVVPDTFNSGLELMESIFSQGRGSRKLCIWGDMLETGDRASEFHLSLRQGLLRAGVHVLLTIGDNMGKLSESLKDTALESVHFNSLGELLSSLKDILADGDLVFIKGSKGMKTYEVLNSLVEDRMKLFV